MRQRHETRARDVCKRRLLNIFIDPHIQPHNLHATLPETLRPTFGEKPRANWGLSLTQSLTLSICSFFGNNTMGIYHMTGEQDVCMLATSCVEPKATCETSWLKSTVWLHGAQACFLQVRSANAR